MRWLLFLLAAVPAFGQLTVKVIEPGPEAPIEAVRVELRLAAGLGPASRFNRQYPDCITGPMGECVFDNLVPGSYAIRVSRAGFIDAEDLQTRVVALSLLMQSSKPVSVEVRLVRTGMIHGTVFSEDGKPVVLAPVRLRLMEPSEPGRRPPSILLRTNETGVFLAEDVPPGKWGMWIITPDRLRGSTQVVDPASGETIGYPVMVYHTGIEEEHWVEPVEVWPGAQLRNRVIVIRKMRTYRIRGQLIDSGTGEPLGNARVALRTGDGVREEVYSQRTVHPQRGTFGFSFLAPGDYELLVYRPSPGPSAPWIVPVNVERGRGARELSLTVPQWSDVIGWVSGPSPPPWWIRSEPRVSLIPESAEEDPLPAIHDRHRFIVRSLPPGRYTLNVMTQEGCYTADASIGDLGVLEDGFTLTEAGVAELRVDVGCQAASLKGEVLDSQDRPVSRAHILLAREFGFPARRLGKLQIHRTGAEGEFFFGNLAPGEYWVIAVKDKPKSGFDARTFWRDYRQQARRLSLYPNASLPIVLPLREQPAN
ncbi:MAG: carboxypeptidase regulatory-like domain-containing protein [Bryobacteraceae bacterium]|nr:carboxypeptidase regulatory-like domain-containing protein [Bryobacteraceae bacterium]